MLLFRHALFNIALCSRLRVISSPATFPAAKAPPPAPAPPPPPPVFPVTNEAECKLLEKSMVVEPKGTCKHVILSADSDGCMCTIPQPGSMNPLPDNLMNPFAVNIPPDPSIPLPPALPTVPPPSNPMAPFVPPMTVPKCPYALRCPSGQKCVGYNSWGFSNVRMAPYSPASRHFNAIYCFYIMKPRDTFKTPDRIASYWRRGEQAEKK